MGRGLQFWGHNAWSDASTSGLHRLLRRQNALPARGCLVSLTLKNVKVNWDHHPNWGGRPEEKMNHPQTGRHLERNLTST